ncbi:septum formation initiator family protein [Plantactinospora sp. KBS50]|uniref:FtsB family cell division protein n=1 Tax=Plantactinospora sp. KBS50 TaxID=2024580 RepID=UPI000BAAE431|nr:septum formation initiator family protein [Plantactinospora sp. KBS50]ASW53668.1 septation ring formation regulator EzrA [Plantactinospora sp. KBS50]
MNQRRTPSGQRPARQPGRPAARGTGREPRVRASGRLGSVRSPAPGRDAARSANRPASARRAAATGAAERTSAPAPRRVTGRATVLFGVLIALALAYTYPVRLYLNQQSEIARLEAAQDAQRKRIGELSDRAALWQDPEYIKTQAKTRFYMVEPGETPLIPLDDPAGAARDAGHDPAATRTGPAAPWSETLWSSIQAANSENQPVQ